MEVSPKVAGPRGWATPTGFLRLTFVNERTGLSENQNFNCEGEAIVSWAAGELFLSCA